MRKFLLLTICLTLAGYTAVRAQGGPMAVSAEPFKVGTFEIQGEPTVGVVLRDSLIVHLAAADRVLERSPMYPPVPMPADMIALIERYEYGLKYRLYELVTHLVNTDQLTGSLPDYIYRYRDLRTLPPIMYPGKILNAAVNFYSHVNESGNEEERAEARRQRRENRGVPYLKVI
jgi:hypothetical protein